MGKKCSGERHSHDTNMQNTLGYDSTPHKHPSHWTNMLGGIEKKCSGENILGLVGSTPHKHPPDTVTSSGAWEESARGKRPSHWEKVLGGNDGRMS